MGYQNIRLTIVGNNVVIGESPVGTASFQLSDALPAVADRSILDALIGEPDVPLATGTSGREVLRQLGELLFKLTLGAWQQLPYAADTARRDGDGLRLLINCEDSAAGALPWELLRDPNGAEYIALAPRTNYSLVRMTSHVAPVPPISTSHPLRLLICGAHPTDQGPLTIAEEVSGVSEALTPLVEEGLIEAFTVPGKFESLVQALSEREWHVLHFIGHGGFTPNTGGILAFEKEDGTTRFVDANQIAREIGQVKTLQLVVLSSCQTGAASAGVVSTAETLVREADVGAVLTMQFSISNWAATQFAGNFYRGLAQSGSVEIGASAGRVAVAQAANPRGLPSLEWATPILFLRGNGLLFDIGAGRQESHGVGEPDPAGFVAASPAAVEKIGRLDWQLTANVRGDYAAWLERARMALLALGATKVEVAGSNTLIARLGGFSGLGAFMATEEVSVKVSPVGVGVLLVLRSRTIQTMLFDSDRNEAFIRNLAAQLRIPVLG